LDLVFKCVSKKIFKYLNIKLIIMRSVVKVRQVNRAKFVAIPKELMEKIKTDYMAVRLDEAGRLIYTPISEAE